MGCFVDITPHFFLTIFSMGILGLLDRSEYARKSTTLARRKICNSCEFQWKPQKQCSICYCFTHFKTMLTKEFCPKRYWRREDWKEGDLDESEEIY